MIQNEKKYEYWLASIQNLSDNKKHKLREHMNSAKRAYYIEETELNTLNFLSEKEKNVIKQAQKELNPDYVQEELEKKGVSVVLRFEEKYPRQLQSIPDRPYAIFYKGSLPTTEKYSVGIVGARQCTPYGEKYAFEFAQQLAQHRVQIISGLAKGIDGISQRGALMGGGQTFAVLGNGVDICYPRENIGLYMDIQREGGIISEQIPGEPPMSYHFPLRNRIISGLADVVLVMEAKEKSGSLITTDMALEQGRDVYALPGPVTSTLSQGCHRLIRQGAGILISPEEFLKELQIEVSENSTELLKNEKMLETTEKVVYSCLDLFPRNVSEIQMKTGLDARILMETLMTLEMEGYIKETAKNYYVRMSDVR